MNGRFCFWEAPNLYLLPFKLLLKEIYHTYGVFFLSFFLSLSKVKWMTYNLIFSLYTFSSWNDFFHCLLLLLSFSSLVRSWYWDFLRLLFDYTYLFAYSITVEYWRLQRKHIKLPIDVFTVFFLFLLRQKFQLDAFVCFGRGKLYIWSFAKINCNECHIHSIVYIRCVLIENITNYRIYFKPSK